MALRKRPRIGVTGPDSGGSIAWAFTRLALLRAGALPVRITPLTPTHACQLDGLVLGGGADVSEPLREPPPYEAPARSRRRRGPRLVDLALAPLVLGARWTFGTRAHGVDGSRDAQELALLAEAARRNLPVLGICRGAQLMNLAAGGSLSRNVSALYEERPDLYTVLPRREVVVERPSRLCDVLGVDNVLVNSLHFHAVDRPGAELRVVARERAGVVQAIEHVSRPFWIGVQWHPEYLPLRGAQRRLFEGLVAAACAPRLNSSESPTEGSDRAASAGRRKR